MKRFLQLLTLDAPHRLQVNFFIVLITFIYFFQFGVNDIWTPNESFYAEAVREMFESGNFLEIFYNYEPRYNKPPLTYWLMAGSAWVFGLSEFSLRLPIVLLGLGSVWLTYLLGKQLYGNQGGIYVLIMMAFTVQLLAVKQYASPEMPLTFFFTLTLYGFIKGYQENKSKYLFMSYIALGLTILTKGFPYLIIISGIIGLYILTSSSFQWKRIKHEIGMLKLPLGLPIALTIGLCWIIFMYIKDGQNFWEVYYRETFGRALTKDSPGLQPLFYFKVITWSILPYTLAFIYALIYAMQRKRRIHRILFPLCWLLVMLIIFTVAKGKIPTYMIQAHPALVLIIVPLLLRLNPAGWSKKILMATFIAPSALIVALNFWMVSFLNLSAWVYGLAGLSLVMFVFLLVSKRGNPINRQVVIPFWAMFFILFSFATLLPRLEQYRPYDIIGQKVNQIPSLSVDTPIHLEGTLIHNIPYYTQRKALRDATVASIQSHPGEKLALIRAESLSKFNSNYQKVWSGLIYDFPSESQFAKFIMACVAADNGDLKKFTTYYLIHQPLKK